jgi:hypothetical protein
VGSADFGRHLWFVEDTASERTGNIGAFVVIYLDRRVVDGDKLLLALVDIDCPGIAAAGDRNAGYGFGDALRVGGSEGKGKEGEQTGRSEKVQRGPRKNDGWAKNAIVSGRLQ